MVCIAVVHTDTTDERTGSIGSRQPLGIVPGSSDYKRLNRPKSQRFTILWQNAARQKITDNDTTSNNSTTNTNVCLLPHLCSQWQLTMLAAVAEAMAP